jgi:hypothetical protein
MMAEEKKADGFTGQLDDVVEKARRYDILKACAEEDRGTLRGAFEDRGWLDLEDDHRW